MIDVFKIVSFPDILYVNEGRNLSVKGSIIGIRRRTFVFTLLRLVVGALNRLISDLALVLINTYRTVDRRYGLITYYLLTRSN